MQWTISNQLTVGRVALIPVLIAAFYFFPEPWNHYGAAFVFALAGFTDWLDGYLARSRGEVTAFGRFLDPVADKLLVATSLVLLVDSHDAPAILAMVIIGREIAIGALREWLAERASVVHVSTMGKWKTAAQLCAIEGLLFHESIVGVSMQDVGLILLWFASVLTLWSGYDYLRASWSNLRAPQA
ncbi:MAG: CDP-diacylglycerol--glycerol-3-phosphate 3-phosphatidyltransferase [Mariprofundaceae bacterium]|nr:CDP-diacylglycerol--glycerol-3-phosphate 3-phosphatidyltransferase [Mariprofundaceae bacterium]